MSLRRDFIKIPLAAAVAGSWALAALPATAQQVSLLNVFAKLYANVPVLRRLSRGGQGAFRGWRSLDQIYSRQ